MRETVDDEFNLASVHQLVIAPPVVAEFVAHGQKLAENTPKVTL
jgi:hypothetical protein